MSIKDEFKKMISELTKKFTIPPIANIFFRLSIKAANPKMPSLWQ